MFFWPFLYIFKISRKALYTLSSVANRVCRHKTKVIKLHCCEGQSAAQSEVQDNYLDFVHIVDSLVELHRLFGLHQRKPLMHVDSNVDER